MIARREQKLWNTRQNVVVTLFQDREKNAITYCDVYATSNEEK